MGLMGPMGLTAELVRQIHAAGKQLVFALNGGSRAVAELLEVPGGSKILLEASPYPTPRGRSPHGLAAGREQLCSSRTARAMAVVGFGRALHYGAAEATAAGIACSASLATDRPKRSATAPMSPCRRLPAVRVGRWNLRKALAAAEEEQIVSRLVLDAVAEALTFPRDWSCRCWCRNGSRWSRLPRRELGRISFWDASSTGCDRKSRTGGSTPRVIFAGAFNPMHAGHRRMAEIAQEMLSLPTAMELSILTLTSRLSITWRSTAA